MTIEQLLEQAGTDTIPVNVLAVIAADAKANGQDVVRAFRQQLELRESAVTKITDEYRKNPSLGAMTASDQRRHDKLLEERDGIGALVSVVEQRTATSYNPPASQAAKDEAPEPLSPVLGKETRATDWLRKRGGFVYEGERGVENISTGRILRAIATGNRQGLTALEQRVMSEGSGPSGQYAVPEVLASRIIDMVRARSVVQRAGAMIVPMTSETLSIARVASGPTTTWKSENQAITPSDLVLERVLFTARTLPVLVKMSVELSEDAQNLDAAIERAMSAAIATELDRVCLVGSGTPPEPQGILNQTGVTIDTGSSASDYDFIVDLIGAIWAANHEPNALITSAGMAAGLAKLKETVNNQPLRQPDVVAALQKFRTTNIPSGSPAASDVFVGDFTQLMIGVRTNFTLEVSRQAADATNSAFTNLQVWIRCYMRADVQLAHPEAFAVAVDVSE